MSRRKNVAKREVKPAAPAKTADAKLESVTATSVKTEENVVVNEDANAVETKTDAPKKRGRKPAAEKVAEEKAVEEKVADTAKTEIKKAATKVEKEVVEEVFFEFKGEQFLSNTLVDRIKEEWKNEGHRISSIKTLRVYVDVEERKAYYVINDKGEGKFVNF